METQLHDETALQKAIRICGGQTALAEKMKPFLVGRKLKISQGHIGNWLNRDGGVVPPDYVIPAALATDFEVTPHQFRVDIYPNPSDGLPQQEAQEAA